jgi:hypothetical protein
MVGFIGSGIGIGSNISGIKKRIFKEITMLEAYW